MTASYSRVTLFTLSPLTTIPESIALTGHGIKNITLEAHSLNPYLHDCALVEKPSHSMINFRDLVILYFREAMLVVHYDEFLF